ncbi:MAG: amidohydrolase family protein [Bacteroidales bacterium]|nr:amidohydrolase family protein [Bacteroidales bacterium]
MKRIGANYIITNQGEPLKNAYLELEDDGTIIQIVHTNGELKEVSGLSFYNGVLVPGFVNAHAHLELSHLKNLIETHKGLPHFIQKIRSLRSQNETDDKAMKQADKTMQVEGIVLVGDISNGPESIKTKSKSPIRYHTFVEVFGLDKYKAHDIFEKAENLVSSFQDAGLKAGIVPHAPYSVSEKLFELISGSSYEHNTTLSMHNQETASENQMFIDKTGELVDGLLSSGIKLDYFYPTGFNSLPSTLVQLPKCSKINLVHNTYTEQADIDKTKAYTQHAFWTLCPNANLYIENKLPNIDLLLQNDLKICIGTDSLASNERLSILNELKTIQNHYPEIPFATLIRWATLNGAEMLDESFKYGSFEKGKKPGINLIENFDFKNFKLNPESKVKVLL